LLAALYPILDLRSSESRNAISTTTNVAAVLATSNATDAMFDLNRAIEEKELLNFLNQAKNIFSNSEMDSVHIRSVAFRTAVAYGIRKTCVGNSTGDSK
jgi:hypothetical protein